MTTANKVQLDVKILATAQGREVGSAGHAKARSYLLMRMAEVGLKYYEGNSFELPYNVQGLRFTNLVGKLPGRTPDKPPILIGAHYDTFGCLPGADDNAAGVAALLATAEHFRGRAHRREIIFALFDAEEPPFFHSEAMGSTWFYCHQMREPADAAIILDLVGHDLPLPGLEDVLIVTGMESDPAFEGVIRVATSPPGVSTVPTLNSYVGDMSDNHVFNKHGRPCLLLTCGRWEHYHSHTDTPDRLNYRKIAAVALYVSQLAQEMDWVDFGLPSHNYDTTQTEIEFLKKNVLPSMKKLGLGAEVQSRGDIDHLVRMLMSWYGL